MNFLIDIGNSRIKWLFHDPVKDEFSLAGAMFHNESELQGLFCEYWSSLEHPERVLVSNVSGSDIAESLNTWVKKEWRIKVEYMQTEKLSYGVHNAYPAYYKLGVDRWMAIIAAWQRYNKDNAAICIVDCGSATTIDGISQSGQHLGGFILPGYKMMQEVLINNTSDINLVKETIPSISFSNTTEQAVASGCYIAMFAAIDQAVTLIKDDYHGQIRCIITGGYAELVIKQLTEKFEYEPHLVLHGLAILSGQ